MKTGISTACFYGRRETEETFSLIKDCGAENCEVFLQTYYEYRPEFAKKYHGGLEGVNVNSVHTLTTNFEPQLFFPARRSRGDGFYWLDQVMRSCQIFGAKRYTFHGISRKGGERDDFGFLAERLNEIIAFCARFGVTLCLENVSWSLYNRPGVFSELKQRSGGLAGAFDLKQARRSGYPYQMYIKEMGQSIAYAHLSDVGADGRMCLPGKGVYDFTEIIKVLTGEGFGGTCLIEAYSDNYGEISELKTSLEYLNEIIYKLS